MIIRHLWQLKSGVLLHCCLMRAVLLFLFIFTLASMTKMFIKIKMGKNFHFQANRLEGIGVAVPQSLIVRVD